MKKLVFLFLASTTATLFAFSPDATGEESEPAYTGSDASKWIPLYGDKWFDHYAESYVGLYPGGRSNRYHDMYIAEAWYDDPITKDWIIFDKKYIYDENWFAVLWFYKATNTTNGFQQVESTIGMGRITDGKLDIWIEYFDDAVGHMQELRIMPFFKEGGEGLPWPPDAPIKQEYRP